MSTIINATTTNGVVIQPDNSGSLQLATNNGTTAVTISTAQNVGIGTSSFAFANRVVVKQSADNSAAGLGARIERNANDSSLFLGYRDNSDSWQVNASYSSTGAFKPITFHTSDTEAMRIDSSGNVLVNTTSAGDGKVRISANANAFNPLKIDDTGSTGGNYIQFLNSAGNQAGAINHNGTTSVNYGSGSDYRLKENITPMANAIAKVAQLKPVTYTWKADGSFGEGFIAHELQAVVPDAVVGEKDAIDAEGKPIYQSVDTSFLVATLTAAIQELAKASSEQQTIINDLKARIETLEAK